MEEIVGKNDSSAPSSEIGTLEYSPLSCERALPSTLSPPLLLQSRWILIQFEPALLRDRG